MINPKSLNQRWFHFVCLSLFTGSWLRNLQHTTNRRCLHGPGQKSTSPCRNYPSWSAAYKSKLLQVIYCFSYFLVSSPCPFSTSSFCFIFFLIFLLLHSASPTTVLHPLLLQLLLLIFPRKIFLIFCCLDSVCSLHLPVEDFSNLLLLFSLFSSSLARSWPSSASFFSLF